jgi:hypothetical protein
MPMKVLNLELVIRSSCTAWLLSLITIARTSIWFPERLLTYAVTMCSHVTCLRVYLYNCLLFNCQFVLRSSRQTCLTQAYLCDVMPRTFLFFFYFSSLFVKCEFVSVFHAWQVTFTLHTHCVPWRSVRNHLFQGGSGTVHKYYRYLNENMGGGGRGTLRYYNGRAEKAFTTIQATSHLQINEMNRAVLCVLLLIVYSGDNRWDVWVVGC